MDKFKENVREQSMVIPKEEFADCFEKWNRHWDKLTWPKGEICDGTKGNLLLLFFSLIKKFLNAFRTDMLYFHPFFFFVYFLWRMSAWGVIIIILKVTDRCSCLGETQRFRKLLFKARFCGPDARFEVCIMSFSHWRPPCRWLLLV